MLRAGRQEILRRSASDSNTTRTHHEGFPWVWDFVQVHSMRIHRHLTPAL
jgi:hypothetical protein